MIANSTYSTVAINQTMRLNISDNSYGDICRPENLEPNRNKKMYFSCSNTIETNCCLERTNNLYGKINLISF